MAAIMEGERMTPELIALARRVVECKNWRWMLGARVVPILADDTIEAVLGTIVEDRGLLLVYWPDVGLRWQGGREHLLPDLADPATLGCLLALVREAWGEDTWVQHEDEWTCFVVLDNQVDHYCGTSEAEALVVALEAAQ